MWKHQRSVRNRSLCVEDLEDRFLLSGGGSLSRGLPLLVPAVRVTSEQTAPDSPEDEAPFSAASSGSHADDDPPDASDLTAARAAATSGARTATASDPGTPGGPIVVIRTGSDIGTVVVSAASSPAASVATPVMHQLSLPVAGSLGGDRPNGILLSDEGAADMAGAGPPGGDQGTSLWTINERSQGRRRRPAGGSHGGGIRGDRSTPGLRLDR